MSVRLLTEQKDSVWKSVNSSWSEDRKQFFDLYPRRARPHDTEDRHATDGDWLARAREFPTVKVRSRLVKLDKDDKVIFTLDVVKVNIRSGFQECICLEASEVQS